MSVGIPSRPWAGPRWGTFAPKRRSALRRAFAAGGIARSWDCALIVVTIGLTGLVAVGCARRGGHVHHREHRLPPVPPLDAGDLRRGAAVAPRGAQPGGSARQR